ncbi:MAG: EutN/CcmL family microcompartment protein [Candidatus Pelagibacter ubique]|uniref:EutN/CcmL family microcompartment protein n=1 Tax=Thermovenabulum sp. TaxID=3100335 RepID=UPI003C7B21EF
MKLAKVIGSCVSTIKESGLKGYKMLLVQDFSIIDNNTVDCPYIAVDLIGAGEGDMVCIVNGSPARELFNQQKVPVDSAIVAIVDSFSISVCKEDNK